MVFVAIFTFLTFLFVVVLQRLQCDSCMRGEQSCIPKPLGLMQDFHGTLLHCGLIDLGYNGNIFTWNNGREGMPMSKLALTELVLGWREIFPHGKVTHVQSSYSDYVPIMLTTHNPH